MTDPHTEILTLLYCIGETEHRETFAPQMLATIVDRLQSLCEQHVEATLLTATQEVIGGITVGDGGTYWGYWLDERSENALRSEKQEKDLSEDDKALIDLALSLPNEQADRVEAYLIQIVPLVTPILAAEIDPQKSAKLQYALIEESLNPPVRNGKIYSPAIEAWLSANHLILTPLGEQMILVSDTVQVVEVEVTRVDEATGKFYYQETHHPHTPTRAPEAPKGETPHDPQQ